jgi:hypothetical protein
LLNVYSYPRSPNVIVVYTAEVIGGRLAAADESLEARIYSATELPWHELAFESTRDALNDYMGDYTDAAVSVPANLLRTAYKVGRGFLDDSEVAAWEDLGRPAP